jgi:uracil-DNA glycosylase
MKGEMRTLPTEMVERRPILLYAAPMPGPEYHDALSALVWLLEEDAAEATGEFPVNRFAKAPPVTEALPRMQPAAEPSARVPLSMPAMAPLPNIARDDFDSIGTAQTLARAANTLAELKASLEGFEGCALKKQAANTVFADGNPASRIMLIGEAPGRDEDRIGLPFVGRAGKLLDKMLAAINLDRSTAYITNVINWRPPENRDPTPEEAAMCLPFLRRHIELVNPGIIILLGAVAARHVMGFSEGIMKLRGRWLEYRVGERMVPVLPTLHPAYLLRQPAHKKLAWRDLQAAEKKIKETGLLEGQGALG